MAFTKSAALLFGSLFLALARSVVGQETDPNYDPNVGSAPPPETGSGMKLGEGMSVSLPGWLLTLILLAFMGGMGWVVMKIINAESERDKKAADKKKARESRKGK